jgi:hypothetical protein
VPTQPTTPRPRFGFTQPRWLESWPSELGWPPRKSARQLRRELETEQWDRYQPSYVGKTEDRRRQHGICRSRGGAVRSTQPIHTTRGSVLGGMVSEGAGPYRKLHEWRVVPGGGSAVGTKRSADLVLCDGERADQPNAGATSSDIRSLEWRSYNDQCALSAVRQNCASEDQAAMR